MLEIIIGSLIAAGVASSIYGSVRNSKNRKQRGETILHEYQSINNFIPTREVKGIENQYIFAIDEDAKQMVLVTSKGKKVIPFRMILGFNVVNDVSEYVETEFTDSESSKNNKEINVDDNKKSSKNEKEIKIVFNKESSQNSASVAKKKVSYVKVQIKTADLKEPNVDVCCFDSNSMCDSDFVVIGEKDEDKYKKGLEDAQSIVDILNIIVAENLKSIHSSRNSNFVADELEKLAKLRDKGLLSNDEYERQKSKLLNTSVENDDSRTGYVYEEKQFPDVQKLINEGHYLQARYLYMDKVGCSEEEAKNYVNSHKCH